MARIKENSIFNSIKCTLPLLASACGSQVLHQQQTQYADTSPPQQHLPESIF